jgi:hypothetical protein
MINARDPRDDQDVTTLPCSIGTGDCEELRDKRATADGYCNECGRPTCWSCAVEIDGGLLRCAYCQEDIEKARAKENEARLADMPDRASMGVLATIITVGCAGYVYVISALIQRWM